MLNRADLIKVDEGPPTTAQLMLRRALEVAPIGVAIVTLEGSLAEANPAMSDILGVTRERLLTSKAQDFAYDDDFEALRELAYSALLGQPGTGEARAVRGDGSVVWLNVSLTLGQSDEGDPTHIVVQIEDISAKRAAREQLENERDLSAALLGALREGYVFTVDNEVRQVNDALCELTGFSRSELVGTLPPYPVWPSDCIDELMSQGREARKQSGGAYEVVWQRKDGTRFDAAMSSRPVQDRDGQVTGWITLVRDISERKAADRRLLHRADHDGLTDLLNQVASHRVLRSEVAAAAAHGRGLTIALLDLDRFKNVNDTFGHATGDTVLAEFARTLSQHARSGDRLGRIGGEEFLWIMPETTMSGAMQALERVSISVREKPFPIVGAVTFSAGLADLCQDENAEDLLARADSQLYVAKRMGRDRVEAVAPPRRPLLFA